MAKSTKTTKATAEKTTKPAAAKPAAPKAKAEAKATPKAKAEPKAKAAPKAAAAKTNGKATSKAAAGDPAEKLAQTCQEAAAKFEKMSDEKYTEIKEKLEWCVGSYSYDKNPAGLKEYGGKAIDLLKEAKKEKPRLVSQKLITDLEKSLASV
uniref:Uncharacterized protein n=1 Tax=Roseihalotalea indica TaxID=2867963 RepID=A0AA49JGQ8_9BACT|nr:hypothetical protein K4G66_03225 [Tunicatimonas sp. TK19036]